MCGPISRVRALAARLGGLRRDFSVPIVIDEAPWRGAGGLAGDFERERGIPPGFVNRLVVETGADGAWARHERGELESGIFMEEFARECRSAGQDLAVPDLFQRMAEISEPRPRMLEAIRRIRASFGTTVKRVPELRMNGPTASPRGTSAAAENESMWWTPRAAKRPAASPGPCCRCSLA